jgi:hypothetical protein
MNPDPNEQRKPVLRILIGFNADPDPAFYVNADPVPDPNSVPDLALVPDLRF